MCHGSSSEQYKRSIWHAGAIMKLYYVPAGFKYWGPTVKENLGLPDKNK
jgi:hypothetical protein